MTPVELPAAIDELAALGPRFVGWRMTSDGRKLPIAPATGKAASSTDPSTWGKIAEAEEAVARDHLTGIGFVLDAARDGIVGIDLDGCRDPDSGAIAPWAIKTIKSMRSYTEISPSQTGVKILVRVDPVPALAANKRTIGKANGSKAPAVEIFTGGRYFTITGRILDDVPDEITDATPAFERLAAWVGKAKSLPDLPAAFLVLLEQDARLRDAWEHGSKLSGGGDTTASALDFTLARYLRPYLDDVDLDVVLRAHPHGQIGSGKLNGRVADRRIAGIIAELGPQPSKAAGRADRQRSFRLLLAEEMPRPTTPRLISKLMGEASLALLYADWAAGKSFLAIDIGCHVAATKSWRGRPVLGGAVAYVAAEAGASVALRIQAWCRQSCVETIPLGIVDASPDLLTGDGLDQFLAELLAFATRMSAPLRLVIIDTVHAAAPGCEETARDFGRVLASARRIIAETGAAVMLVHHAGKDGGKSGARGSNSLEAGVDLVLEVREETTNRAVLVRKMRDGEPPELDPFVIQTVILSEHEGESATAGVAIAVEPEPVGMNDPRREEARKRRAQGESLRTIARGIGVTKSTIERWLS